MSAEEVAVTVTLGENRVASTLTIEDLEPARVRLFGDHFGELEGSGPDLFEALCRVREGLERLGGLLECNGARIDVYPSNMQRQATNGRWAYVLVVPRVRKLAGVDIFAPAPQGSIVATTKAQRENFETWSQLPLELP